VWRCSSSSTMAYDKLAYLINGVEVSANCCKIPFIYTTHKSEQNLWDLSKLRKKWRTLLIIHACLSITCDGIHWLFTLICRSLVTEFTDYLLFFCWSFVTEFTDYLLLVVTNSCNEWLLNIVSVSLTQALCILTNIANGKSAKDCIMGNDDLVGKIVSYLVCIQLSAI